MRTLPYPKSAASGSWPISPSVETLAALALRMRKSVIPRDRLTLRSRPPSTRADARRPGQEGGVSKGERGTALVEFAIVAPLMLVLAFGLLELGRMLFDYQAINSGLRSAARYLGRVPVRCTALGANNGIVLDSSHSGIALNLAFTGKPTAPAGPEDRLVKYWDGSGLTVNIECVDNSAFYSCVPCFVGTYPDTGRLRPFFPRITVSAQVAFPLITTLPLGIGANVTLSAQHIEVNLGE